MSLPPPPSEQNPYSAQPPPGPYGSSAGPSFDKPPARGKPRLRGRIPLRLALIFGVVGIVLVVVGIVSIVNGPVGKIDQLKRVSFADGSRTVHLTRTGDYVAYFEAPVGKSYSAHVRMGIESSSGERVALTQYNVDTTLTYSSGGKHGQALFTFKIAKAGDYVVQVSSEDAASGADMALGESIGAGLVLGVLLVVPGALLVIAAIVLLIVGLVRRSNHKSEIAARGYY